MSTYEDSFYTACNNLYGVCLKIAGGLQKAYLGILAAYRWVRSVRIRSFLILLMIALQIGSAIADQFMDAEKSKVNNILVSVFYAILVCIERVVRRKRFCIVTVTDAMTIASTICQCCWRYWDAYLPCYFNVFSAMGALFQIMSLYTDEDNEVIVRCDLGEHSGMILKNLGEFPEGIYVECPFCKIP
ncbi:uncharacterized protein LOC132314902 [Cornus florida]|uniref:uncharacterized protein LOC132314902 n=1 Tax=Cornus florida TaxID=4283 RepID=UPI00289FB2CE|nr:uncharacterized protein LOC132314902 [Cornus florida]